MCVHISIYLYIICCACVSGYLCGNLKPLATCISTTFQHLSPPLARRNIAVARFTLLNSPCLLHQVV